MKHKLLYLLPIIALLYSCDSVSDGTLNKIKNTQTKLDNTENTIKRNDSTFTAYVKTLGSVGNYAKKENLYGEFDKALKYIKSGESVYNSQIKPLIEKDESKSEPKMLSHNGVIENYIKLAKTTSEYPMIRINLLKKIDSDAKKFLETSKNNLNLSEIKLSEVEKLANTYKQKYPKQNSAIDKMVNNLSGQVKVVDKYVANIETEYNKKVNDNDANLTIIADSYNNVVKITNDIVKGNKEIKSRLKELDQGYSKTLEDIKVKFYVQVGRTSWDSYSDFNTDTNHIYSPREVDEETFKYFDKLPNNTVLASETGYGTDAPSVKINKSMWNKLNINHKEKYPSGDDDSEYWVNNTIAKYYHKYLIEDNGKIVSKDKWVEVDEDLFYENLENIGMTIYSKPIGQFESEAIKSATPAGMQYVGNQKYGQWKKDSNGNDFWAFYGQYMFFSQMFGGNNYYRSEYDDYNRNYRSRGRSYYGSNGNHRYGTRGTAYKNSNAYKSSNYKRSYASNKKSSFGSSSLRKTSRSQRATTRAGSSRRGGGPGGGGK